MSEDSAHGQHFEPPTNGAATGAQAQQAAATPEKQMTIEQALDEQVNRVHKLAVRVGTLISTAEEAFTEFVTETSFLFFTLQSLDKDIERTNANRPTNQTTTQARA